MIAATLMIRNTRGLHARAAAKFVQTAERFDARVEVSKDGQTVTGCSIMGLMMLAAAKGTTINIVVSGTEAQLALEAITELVEAGFHEEN